LDIPGSTGGSKSGGSSVYFDTCSNPPENRHEPF